MHTLRHIQVSYNHTLCSSLLYSKLHITYYVLLIVLLLRITYYYYNYYVLLLLIYTIYWPRQLVLLILIIGVWVVFYSHLPPHAQSVDMSSDREERVFQRQLRPRFTEATAKDEQNCGTRGSCVHRD